MPAPAVIELVGIPGAGKSTVARELCRQLEAAGRTPLVLPEAGRQAARRSRLGRMLGASSPRWGPRIAWKVFQFERLARGLGFLVARPVFGFRLVAGQARRPPAARRGRRVLYWWVRTVGARSVLLRHRLPDEVVVFDEGLCHRVVQLFASADETPDPAGIARYARAIPFPDVLIHVVAPTELAFRRVHERGLWRRLAGEDPRRIRRYLESAAVAISHLLATDPARAGTVVELENAAELPVTGLQDLLAAVGAVS